MVGVPATQLSKLHRLQNAAARLVSNQGRPGRVVVYQYTRKKNRQNTPKIPKIHPKIPQIIPRYTLHLKFKESDIPNTRI